MLKYAMKLGPVALYMKHIAKKAFGQELSTINHLVAFLKFLTKSSTSDLK